MSVYKAEITIIIVVLVLFGIFIWFSGMFQPIMENIANAFGNQVDSVFEGVEGNVPEPALPAGED